MIDIQSISDEYIGLPSGFFFAGSQNVVSSLWTVNDLSTAFLMIKFYQILLDSNQQVSMAIALKTAQNWLRTLNREQFIAFLIHKRYIPDPEQLNQQRFKCAAQMREPLYIREQQNHRQLGC